MESYEEGAAIANMAFQLLGGHPPAQTDSSHDFILDAVGDSAEPKYSNKYLTTTHYRAAREEEIPLIRLAAALLRCAVDELRAGDDALDDLQALRATPYPKADAEREARAAKLTRLIEAIERADLSIAWLNGADAPAPFWRVCSQLEVSADTARAVVAKELDIERKETQEGRLLVSRWRAYK